MAVISAKTNISRKIDLNSEVMGVLPSTNLSPTITTAVADYYSPGTISTDGYALTLTKDSENKLPFLRLKAGTNITLSQSGNSVLITASSSAGGSGDMLKSVYDTVNRGYVDRAVLADTTPWSGIISPPTTFPPATHTHPESDVINLTTDLAARALSSTLINTANSLTGGGSLAANRTLSLLNDLASPGNNFYYGTSSSGIKGWIADPYVVGGMAKSVYATNGLSGTVDQALFALGIGAGAVISSSFAPGAVNTAAIGDAQVTGAKLASGAAVNNLGFTPVNDTGDQMSGPLGITAVGQAPGYVQWQNSHLLLQTTGAGTGTPTLGFAMFNPGGSLGGAATIAYLGGNQDLLLTYSSGLKASLLSAASQLPAGNLTGQINGGLLTPGSVPLSAMSSLAMMPAGSIIIWPTDLPPAGWLSCNGQSLQTTAQPALFAVLGYTYGGSGATFNLPNFSGRVPMQTTLGTTGGGSTALSVANLPSHLHNISGQDPGHVHTYLYKNLEVAGVGGLSGFGFQNIAQPLNTVAATTGIVNTGFTGSGTAFSTLPPYLGINFIIKT